MRILQRLALNVGPTVRSARSVKQQSRMAKLHCFLDQPTQSGQFGFSIKFCHPTGISMPKSNVLFHHTAIKHKMNVALQKFALGATHYCKFKHTALCKNALHFDNKTTINQQILCRFQKNFFQRSKNWNTPFYLQMFCALSGRSLSWNTPVFSRFTSREHANLVGCKFFPHSYASPSFKGAAPRVLWEKVIFRRSKELKSEPGSCTLVWAPFWKFGWRHHISSYGCGLDWPRCQIRFFPQSYVVDQLTFVGEGVWII